MPKTVFVSSTYEDLMEHRKAVWEVIDGLGLLVRGMKQFGARTESPLETCMAELDQSDIYVGIIGPRFGTLDTETGKSYTQLEYDSADTHHKQVHIYRPSDEARLRNKDIEIDAVRREKLEAFKRALADKHTVDTYTAPEDLADKVRRDLSIYAERQPTAAVPQDEFLASAAALHKFGLVQLTASGTEIRLQAVFIGSAFPASRDLCEAFNFEYGSTVAARVKITAPDCNEAQKMRLMCAPKRLVESFLALIQAHTTTPADVYARIQFSPKNVSRHRAEVFGDTYGVYDPADDYNPYEVWVPAEGQAILQFSKVATG